MLLAVMVLNTRYCNEPFTKWTPEQTKKPSKKKNQKTKKPNKKQMYNNTYQNLVMSPKHQERKRWLLRLA